MAKDSKLKDLQCRVSEFLKSQQQQVDFEVAENKVHETPVEKAQAMKEPSVEAGENVPESVKSSNENNMELELRGNASEQQGRENEEPAVRSDALPVERRKKKRGKRMSLGLSKETVAAALESGT